MDLSDFKDPVYEEHVGGRGASFKTRQYECLRRQ
jgi:hypothetical protein